MKTPFIIAAVALFATPALAQVSTAPAPPEDAFIKIDADGDGGLSLAEVQKEKATVTKSEFDRYDTDSNAALNRAEFEAWTAARKHEESTPEG